MKRKSVLYFVVAFIYGCGGDCLDPSGCGKTSSTPGSSNQTTSPTPSGSASTASEASIVLRVEGTATAVDISYSGGGTTGDVNNATLPWQRTFTASKGDVLFVSGANVSASGTVRVIILSGGNILKEAGTNAPKGYTSVLGSCC